MIIESEKATFRTWEGGRDGSLRPIGGPGVDSLFFSDTPVREKRAVPSLFPPALSQPSRPSHPPMNDIVSFGEIQCY